MSVSENSSFCEKSHQNLIGKDRKLGAITKGLFVEEQNQEYVIEEISNFQTEKDKTKTQIQQSHNDEDYFSSLQHHQRKKKKKKKKLQPQIECEPVQISFSKQKQTIQNNPEANDSRNEQINQNFNTQEQTIAKEKQQKINQNKPSYVYDLDKSQSNQEQRIEQMDEIDIQEKKEEGPNNQVSRQKTESNQEELSIDEEKKIQNISQRRSKQEQKRDEEKKIYNIQQRRSEQEQERDERRQNMMYRHEQMEQRQQEVPPLIRAFHFILPHEKETFIIERDEGKIHPIFNVCDLSNKYFMSIKLCSNNSTLTFLASVDPKSFSENNESYVGKIKSNFIGNTINIFGPGYNPSDVKKKMKKPRELLATVSYQTNFFGKPKPRNFSVYTLRKQVSYNNNLYGVKLGEEEVSLDELYKNPENRKNIMVLDSKKPEWNTRRRAFVLNFKGRVKKASVKNFILEDLQKFGEQKQSIVFGKISQNVFRVDIQNQMSPFVGIGIAMSTFGSKLGCE